MIVKIPFEQLSTFVGNLSTCLTSGINVPQSLKTCTRSSPSRVLREMGPGAAERVEAGMPLSDALEPDAHCFPPFFLPVIRCGEQVGRLDEALEYLQQHCLLLVAPSKAMRNTWLFPLIIVATGSLIKMAAYVVFAPVMVALVYAARTLLDYGIVAAVLYVVYKVPQAKSIVDRAKLLVPVLGQAERELAVNRFFHAFNLVYSTGGMRVEAMIKLAAATVDNDLLRSDFLRALSVIEARGSITEAFAAVIAIAEEHKALITAGEEGGKLEEAFATISRLTGESVRHRLTMFNQIFFRIVAAMVMLSIVFTVFSLVVTFSRVS